MLRIGNKVLEKVNKIKFLGVALDCNHSLNDHFVNPTHKKLGKSVRLLRKVRSLSSFMSLNLIYILIISF